ncbi:hypothetical protein K469DRAFT_360796 [Zopfia rhizophila CBS 207.26]|uniref:Fungal N-terminal domain-containing protein n=1 Tax=Zopfia rhizophila CBS 207.26 TaxID=1314779 RepID=A0A6A6EJ68_9PEZI|nr:hypothetical protein K469DRAFT_360796 [Zopfia rhizophila CBS 207.26]
MLLTMDYTVNSLQTAIRELHDEISGPTSVFHRGGQTKRTELGKLIQRCDASLKDLENLLA